MQLEVPFIAFYRKEYVTPELNVTDLWKVYKYDGRWCQLLSRKKGLISLYEKMRDFQLDRIMLTPDDPIPDDVRIIRDDDIDHLKHVQTPEELKDAHTHFLLYYSHDIQAMQDRFKVKERERKRREKQDARRKLLEDLEEGVEPPPEEPDTEELDDGHQEEGLKQTLDAGPYAMCRKNGICGFAKKFGLTPEQYAENLRDSYQRHEPEQEPTEPSELAKEYLTPNFSTVEDVLHAAKFVVARQIAREPLLRKSVREIFYERAKISVKSTKKGLKEIDENHACFTMKYLKDKPVCELVGEQFLKLHMAEDDKLLTITISEKIEGNTTSSYLDEIKQLYIRDEFAKHVQDWNDLRTECVELAVNKMVLPDLRKEIHSVLLNEAKDCVLKACVRKLYTWIKVCFSIFFALPTK